MNLLPMQPLYYGLGSYIKCVVPDIDGLHIQVNQEGELDLIEKKDWLCKCPPQATKIYQYLLQTDSLLNFGKSLKNNNLTLDDIGTVYFLFLDFV